MNLFRNGLLSLVTVAMLVVLNPSRAAQDADQKKRPAFQQFGRGSTLLPADAADKLQLSGETKEKFQKIVNEFEAKQKEAQEKVKAAFDKARQDKDREAFKKIFEQAKDAGQASQKLREDLFAKLREVLNDDQKKKLDELKNAGPRIGGGLQPFPGQGGIRPFGQPGGGQLIAPAVQEQLNLTAEQKEKLAKIQKEADARVQELLTADQKKKLEELKKAGPGVRPQFKRPAQ